MCGSMADIQSAAAKIRRGKKRGRTNYSMKIWSALLHRATINKPTDTTKIMVTWLYTNKIRISVMSDLGIKAKSGGLGLRGNELDLEEQGTDLAYQGPG